MSLSSQADNQRFHPLHRALSVVLYRLSEKRVNPFLACLAVTSQGFHDPVGMPQVDLIRVLLVLALLAESLQVPPTSRLIPREHPQSFGQRLTQVGTEMSGVQD